MFFVTKTESHHRVQLAYKEGSSKLFLDVHDRLNMNIMNMILTIEQAKELGEKLIEFSAVAPKFYIKIMDKYVNYDTCDGRYFLATAAETGILKTQFTLEEINNEPKLKEFAEYKIPVNSAVSW